MPDMPMYLRNDYSIACNSSRYRFGVLWATLAIVVYPVGITSFYAAVLYKNRRMIQQKDWPTSQRDVAPSPEEEDEEGNEAEPPPLGRTARWLARHGLIRLRDPNVPAPRKRRRVRLLSLIGGEIEFLHRAYKGECWYWEVRRLSTH